MVSGKLLFWLRNIEKWLRINEKWLKYLIDQPNFIDQPINGRKSIKNDQLKNISVCDCASQKFH